MTIKDKINEQYREQKYSKITRRVTEDCDLFSRGYIVDYSEDFVILQETDDFKVLGFNILPIRHFEKIRYNNYDKYYDKIMTLENEKINVGLKNKVNLTSWKTIFRDFQKKKMNVIVECEAPNIDTFTIGPVKKVTDKNVFILCFDPAGFFDEKPTRIDYDDISKVMFDDRYVDIFSKYTRERRKRKK
jgi:hypothetical protein